VNRDNYLIDQPPIPFGIEEGLLFTSGNACHYPDLLKQIREGVIVHSGEKIVFANDNAASILGAENAGTLTGMCFCDLVHPDDRRMFVQKPGAPDGNGKLISSKEARFIRLDGGQIYTESSDACCDWDGRQAIQVVFRDITREKRTMEKWDAITSELNRSQRIAHLGSWEFKLPDMEATWSDEAFRILGLEPSKDILDFEKWIGYVHPEDRLRVTMVLMKSWRDPKPSKVEFRVVTAGGQVRHVYLEWDTEPDEQGNPARVFGIVQDVTELRKTEAELKEARAQAELYLDLMSHDINNMNLVAQGYLEYALCLINAGKSIDDENKFCLEKPFKSLKSNSRLIEIVTKVRMEKAGVYKHEFIDIGKMLEGVKDELTGINGREIAIGLTCGCACRVQANELLKDVFTNLVGNAIKHSDPGKSLRIDITAGTTMENDRKYCMITVADNGPGMPDDRKRELMDRLALDKPQSTGKGFGLYLARMLVKDYDGRLTLEDRVPGDYSQGCRFVVMLPAADQ